MIKIVVDLLGADKQATQLVDGALDAINENKDLFLYICADKQEMEKYLDNKVYNASQIELVDCPEAITNIDNPEEAFRTKKNSSLVKGMILCEQNQDIGGFVSCGPTGALFVGAIMLLGRIDAIRPMLLCQLIKQDGAPFCVVDCGANVDCRPAVLCDFAKMGTAYMKTIGVMQPRVGLLSNGSEDGKGNITVKKANELLRNTCENFVGNIEGSHVLHSDADIIVCEGFAGNILLKTIEGSAKAAITEIKQRLQQSAIDGITQEAYSAVTEIIKNVYLKYDYNSEGGAVLLGSNIPVVKGHGEADSRTVYHIINIAYKLAKNNLI